VRQQHLDHAPHVEDLVLGAVHRAHPALPDLGPHRELADLRADHRPRGIFVETDRRAKPDLHACGDRGRARPRAPAGGRSSQICAEVDRSRSPGRAAAVDCYAGAPIAGRVTIVRARGRLAERPARMAVLPAVSTKADPKATAWTIRDPIVRLRYFGSERALELAGSARWILGSSTECSMPLDDPSGRISRRHAALTGDDEDVWTMQDLGSMNGIRQNREDRRAFQLAPGDELELGGVTLIAESRRSIELHELLRRWLGWSAARLAEVDLALRAVREMAHLRAALILRGEGPLHGIARRLHRAILGDRPLAALGSGELGVEALDRAVDGLLCLDARALPSDLPQVVAALRTPRLRVRLIAFAQTRAAAARIAARIPRIATICLPPLAERQAELDRLIETYGLEAAAELGAPGTGFRALDPRWMRARGLRTLDDLDEVTRRVVALRNYGVAGGARRIGITHGALSRWLRRRRIPT
jgi:hypothetical protein